jgi:hypothetical protein
VCSAVVRNRRREVAGAPATDRRRDVMLNVLLLVKGGVGERRLLKVTPCILSAIPGVCSDISADPPGSDRKPL